MSARYHTAGNRRRLGAADPRLLLPFGVYLSFKLPAAAARPTGVSSLRRFATSLSTDLRFALWLWKRHPTGFGLSRALNAMFWGMTSVDPVAFGAISALMLAAALVAAWVPVHRVTRIDPQRALRYE